MTVRMLSSTGIRVGMSATYYIILAYYCSNAHRHLFVEIINIHTGTSTGTVPQRYFRMFHYVGKNTFVPTNGTVPYLQRTLLAATYGTYVGFFLWREKNTSTGYRYRTVPYRTVMKFEKNNNGILQCDFFATFSIKYWKDIQTSGNNVIMHWIRHNCLEKK